MLRQLSPAALGPASVITFVLWHWDLDDGGSAAKAVHGARHNPARVCSEMTHQEMAPAHWYPQFVDYLAFSFNTLEGGLDAGRRWAPGWVTAISLA